MVGAWNVERTAIAALSSDTPTPTATLSQKPRAAARYGLAKISHLGRPIGDPAQSASASRSRRCARRSSP
jgi:hypothetical protein